MAYFKIEIDSDYMSSSEAIEFLRNLKQISFFQEITESECSENLSDRKKLSKVLVIERNPRLREFNHVRKTDDDDLEVLFNTGSLNTRNFLRLLIYED